MELGGQGVETLIIFYKGLLPFPVLAGSHELVLTGFAQCSPVPLVPGALLSRG